MTEAAGEWRMGPKLSPREREIARLVAGGLHDREIADRLCLAEQTVKNTIGNIYRRMGLYQSVNQRVTPAVLVTREEAGGA